MNQILCTEEFFEEKTKKTREFNNKIEKIQKLEKTTEVAKIEPIIQEEHPVSKPEKVRKTKNRARRASSDWKISLRRIERKTLTSMAIICCICLLFSYCIYACGIILKDDTQAEEVLAVTENIEPEEIVEEIPQEPEIVTTTELIGIEETEYTSNSGETYTIAAILNIPSLDIRYPVLSKNTDELMEISLNYYWGSQPNEVGNCCIVGHNYLNKTHFGKLPGIKIGDEVEITDSTGRTVTYVVYKTFIIDPEDTECTSQLTDGRTEITLITCANGGASRFVAKAVAIEK